MSLFVLPNVEWRQCGRDWFEEGDTVYFRDLANRESEIRCEKCSQEEDRPAIVRMVVEASLS